VSYTMRAVAVLLPGVALHFSVVAGFGSRPPPGLGSSKTSLHVAGLPSMGTLLSHHRQVTTPWSRRRRSELAPLSAGAGEATPSEGGAGRADGARGSSAKKAARLRRRLDASRPPPTLGKDQESEDAAAAESGEAALSPFALAAQMVGPVYEPPPLDPPISKEDAQMAVDYLNERHASDLATFASTWGDVAYDLRSSNGFQRGSLELMEAKAVELSQEGTLVLECALQRKGFFGNLKPKESGVRTEVALEDVFGGGGGGEAAKGGKGASARQVLGLCRADSVTAAEAKRALLRTMVRAGRPAATASLLDLPIGRGVGGQGGGDAEELLLPKNLFLNNVPNTLATRYYFYDAAVAAVEAALRDPDPSLKARMQMQVLTPELNPTTDSYRVGTLLELVREVATCLACSGLRVRVCIQGAMGRGTFVGLPLSLNGVRQIVERMDWLAGPGEAFEGMVASYEGVGEKGYVRFGEIGAAEVDKDPTEAPDDAFILISPQNIVGFSIVQDLQEMVVAANGRPVLLVNPNLKDVQSSEDTMSARGRSGRLAFAESFQNVYSYKTLYPSETVAFPIVGAVVKVRGTMVRRGRFYCVRGFVFGYLVGRDYW